MDYYQKYLKYKNKYIQLKNLYGSGCKKTGKSRVGSAGAMDYSGISCTVENPQYGDCYKDDYGNCDYKEKCGNSTKSNTCNANPKGCYWTGKSCKQTKKVDCGDSSTEDNCKTNPKGCSWTGNKCKKN